jgi:hypothetical protein
MGKDQTVRINNFCLPRDAAYFAQAPSIEAKLTHLLGVPMSEDSQPRDDAPMLLDVRAVGMLLWQALSTLGGSGDRLDFRADVPMDVRHLVARLAVRHHPAAITSATEAVAAIEEQVRELESVHEDDGLPTPPLLHALHLARQSSESAPWAEAETVIDQPAPGPSSTPRSYTPPYGMPPAPAYVPGGDIETTPSQRRVPSVPLRPGMPGAAAPQTGPGVGYVGGVQRGAASSRLWAAGEAPGYSAAAPASQPRAYRPSAPIAWNDSPEVARWVAGSTSRPRGWVSGVYSGPRRGGLRVAFVVLLGIALFVLAFVLGYFGPPILPIR